ncbi:MAG: dynamin family protein [Aliarcobacter sp.]|nr:dynamin family protein [Aliarcobacter sp.]
MKLIEISKKLEEVIEKSDLYDSIKIFKNEFSILETSDLEKTILSMDEENRVLKIGIVGRVNAGKSSLLNALVFDGKDILPKAATPMTAALTKLEYGEIIEANVEFYTQEDIDSLKTYYNKYEEKFEKLKKEKLDELKEKEIKKLKVAEIDEYTKNNIEQKSENIANREMKKDEQLFSSYDQYSKIKASNLSLNELKKFENIQADNIDSLNKKLYDFVGADGKYMPFTKSVTIKLNNENLKDIEIIDTPGINDPIASREERTKELLKNCDVIFVVSPSGQFLSSEDIDLLDRITKKEGIQEIYIIASQIDNQLYGSEKEKNRGDLLKVLESIKNTLTKSMKDVITEQIKQFPYQEDIFDKFMKNDVLYSSGATYSMLQRFEDKENWDDNLNHIWKNLNQHYKDYFSDDLSAKANLYLLSNMQNIQNALKEVREKKDEIIRKRKEEFIKAKLNSFEKYNKSIQKDIKEKIEKIKSSDIKDIKTKKDNLLKVKSQTSEAVNWKYEDFLYENERNLNILLVKEVNKYFQNNNDEISKSEDTKTESYTKDHGFWSLKFGDDRYEKISYDIVVVKAGMIQNALEDLSLYIENSMKNSISEEVNSLKGNIYKQIMPILEKNDGDKNLDLHQIQKSVRNIISSLRIPEINYTNKLPNELKKSGTLKGREAEDFIERAKNYAKSFQRNIIRDIEKHLNTLFGSLKQHNLGEEIFSHYKKEIENLENDIENIEQSLLKNEYILKQLESIK